MGNQNKIFFQSFARVLIAFVMAVCLVRIYEYVKIASKFFIVGAYQFELKGLLYDCWASFIYFSLLLIPSWLLSRINHRLSLVILHIVNVVVIILYLSLLVVFSERTRPFDHEFFTRSAADSWITTKQMLTSGIGLYLPFVIYIALYFLFYFVLLKRIRIKNYILFTLAGLCLLSLVFFRFSVPRENGFIQTAGYHLESNKFSYWIRDSYRYLTGKSRVDASRLDNKELEKEINYYQASHPFEFTSKEYPLMHRDNSKDVLGSFFQLQQTPPNIVILVIEGLSRDFSGDSAYASSFTPFLDSLSAKSLSWDNFLSTAPGTFAAHPAISGSLPYGQKGFSLMSIMPDHLSLIKIMRRNGYQANFMIGFSPDFDNMGGYIRLQGTDLVLSRYSSKYRKMGVGSGGWSMGYPDDALYSRSFEVMDSLHKTPYLNIYHTATTHLPFLFEQHAYYEKLFDEKMKSIHVSPPIKRTLYACKKVLVTYMFSDDCIKKFFADYARRPEFGNTIFFITGDHHIGAFPSTGAIDDYHVPLIIYSPMLRAPKKFYSVNSHNNLAPTIWSLLFNNFRMPYVPQEVHWLGDVLDTCASFRNTQSMAFMAWSREMNDYIYKEYMLSEDQLYHLNSQLLMTPFENDSIKNHIARLLENFKIINSYVCDNNKIYPTGQNLPGQRVLLMSFQDSLSHVMKTAGPDTSLIPDFKIPGGYHYLYVELSAEVKLAPSADDLHPSFRLGLVESKAASRNFLYWSNRDIVLLAKGNYHQELWNAVSTNDLFTLNDYKDNANLVFNLSLYDNRIPIDLKIRQLKVDVYGVR